MYYIKTSSDEISLHEIAHIRQILNKYGSCIFLSKNGEFRMRNAGNNDEEITNNEIEAYQIQYAFSKVFPGTLHGYGIKGINVDAIASILDSRGRILYLGAYRLSKSSKMKEKNGKKITKRK